MATMGQANAALELANRLHEQMARLADNVARSLVREQMLIRRDMGNSEAGTEVELEFTPPPGVQWQVTRIATTSGAGGAMAAYLDSVEPQNLVDYDAGAEINAREVEFPVPDGRKLFIRFFDQPNNTFCTVTIIAKELALGE